MIVRWLVPAILLFSLLVVAGFAWPRPIVGWLESWSPTVRFDADVGHRLVAVTIDDGPSENTDEILEVLDRHGAKATFFLIGSRTVEHEGAVRGIVARGHEIGHHMWRDETTLFLDEGEFARRFKRTERVLERFAPDLAWFRPGGGWYDETMVRHAESRGYRVVLGSAPAVDTFVPSSGIVTRYLLANVRPGAILILHDGPERGPRAVETLRALLPALAREGYRVVDLSQLVAAERVARSTAAATGKRTVEPSTAR